MKPLVFIRRSGGAPNLQQLRAIHWQKGEVGNLSFNLETGSSDIRHSRWVEPEFREQGIGTRLLLRMEKEVKKAGHPKVRFSTHRASWARLLIQNGYTLKNPPVNGELIIERNDRDKIFVLQSGEKKELPGTLYFEKPLVKEKAPVKKQGSFRKP
ncbi:MAG: GNAT family N-acetyltransferase [Candidatus Diapherotrites archaeon]|nr:GNAT family N-acetyltransferase [Candidatus Diapherotrites archaeon]